VSPAVFARRAAEPFCVLPERIHDPAHRRMRAVLDLDPVRTSTTAIWPIPTFRYQTFEPHIASRPKQVGTNLALFESELDQSRDEQRHKMLLTLLAEEKANIQKPLDS
jgi:hypothetical protein